jgi:hypothetical protein
MGVMCFVAADSLDAHPSCDEYSAFDLVHVDAGRRPDKATTHAHIYLLPLNLLWRLP